MGEIEGVSVHTTWHLRLLCETLRQSHADFMQALMHPRENLQNPKSGPMLEAA